MPLLLFNQQHFAPAALPRLYQNLHQRTKPRVRRLEKIEPDKRGQQEPRLVQKRAERQTSQHNVPVTRWMMPEMPPAPRRVAPTVAPRIFPSAAAPRHRMI